jgi:DNA-3-methyladenine glycosylase I
MIRCCLNITIASGAFPFIATPNTSRPSCSQARRAGLNWSLVLKKRKVISGRSTASIPRVVARYSEKQTRSLLADPRIIRNRMKIEAAVRNAGAFLKIQEEFGGFDSYGWRFVGGKPKLGRWKATRQIPAISPESEALSKDLRQRGFSFVGPTVAHA